MRRLLQSPSYGCTEETSGDMLNGIFMKFCTVRCADKSLARPTSRCILFDSENISYINSTNIPPIMIINRIYENQNLLSL